MGSDILPLILGGVLWAGGLLAVLIAMDRQRRAQQDRLMRAARVVGMTAGQSSSGKPRDTRRQRAGDPVGQLLERVDDLLAGAGLRFSAGEILMQLGAAVLVTYAFLVLLVRFNPFLAIPVAVILPAIGAALVIKIARARRIAAFSAGLPEALDVFARGLKAGRPVADALHIVVENAADPVRSELAICHGQMCVGMGLSESFADLARRMPTAEASFFGVATALQAETGGNLIETMEHLADQLRERRKLKQKARALSSEARASAVILASLPFAVGAVIFFLNPEYLSPLFNDPRGQIMLVSALLSILLGIYMMIRMGRLDL